MMLFLISIIPVLGLVLDSRVDVGALPLTGRDRADLDLYRPMKVSILTLLFVLIIGTAHAESGRLYLSCYGKALAEFGRNKPTDVLLADVPLTVDFDSGVVLVAGFPAAPIADIDDSSIRFWWEHESSAYKNGPRCGCGEGHTAESCWYEPLHDAQGHLINREPACSVRNDQTFGVISRITGATKVTVVKWREEETSDFRTSMELTCRPRAPQSSTP